MYFLRCPLANITCAQKTQDSVLNKNTQIHVSRHARTHAHKVRDEHTTYSLTHINSTHPYTYYHAHKQQSQTL